MSAAEVLKGKFEYYGETQAAIEFAMMEYARQKCIEQRAIIHAYQLQKHRAVTADVKDSIFNAPEPYID